MTKTNQRVNKKKKKSVDQTRFLLFLLFFFLSLKSCRNDSLNQERNVVPNVLLLIWPLFIAPADWSLEEAYFFILKIAIWQKKEKKPHIVTTEKKPPKKQGKKKIKTLFN